MTRDDVIRMAREAGLQTDTSGVWVDDGYIENQLTRFAQTVAAIERKAVLNVLWEYAGRKDLSDNDQSLLKHLVDIIRARSVV